MPDTLWVPAPSWTPGLLSREERGPVKKQYCPYPTQDMPRDSLSEGLCSQSPPRQVLTRGRAQASPQDSSHPAVGQLPLDLGRKGPGEWASVWGRGHVQSQRLLHVLQRPKLFTSVCNHLLQIEVKAATKKKKKKKALVCVE